MLIYVAVTVILVIIFVSVYSRQVPLHEFRKVNVNLNFIQETVNFICIFDEMKFVDVQIFQINGNLSINNQEICISSPKSPILCRIALCKTDQIAEFDLSNEPLFNISKNDSGFYFKQ